MSRAAATAQKKTSWAGTANTSTPRPRSAVSTAQHAGALGKALDSLGTQLREHRLVWCAEDLRLSNPHTTRDSTRDFTTRLPR
mmetsp:Transcript_44016/g.138737  ORF Transcript_44016/g.138737 Transcript_44016/m.138737 type:complete len:83 (+) Transcript_44016:71-319(+)